MNTTIAALRAVDLSEQEEPDLEIDADAFVGEISAQGKVSKHMDSAVKLIERAQVDLDKLRAGHSDLMDELHRKNDERVRDQDRAILNVMDEIKRLQDTLLEHQLARTQMVHNMARNIQMLATDQTREQAEQLHVVHSLKAMREALKVPLDLSLMETAADDGGSPEEPPIRVRITKPDPDDAPFLKTLTKTLKPREKAPLDADQNTSSSDSTASGE